MRKKELTESPEQDPPTSQIDALITLFNRGQIDDVLKQVQELLTIFPISFVLWNLMGAISTRNGDEISAELGFRKAAELNPSSPDIQYNLGTNLKKQCKYAEAIVAYERALTIHPNHTQSLYNLGNAFRDLGKLDEAIAAYQRALVTNPNHADALYNMSITLQDQGQLPEAIASFERTLIIKPDYHSAKTYLLHTFDHVCDWRQHKQREIACSSLGIETGAVSTFAMLPLEDNPKRQLKRSQKWVTERYRQKPQPFPERTASGLKRLRVGYFSSDFHDHATLHLMAGLLRDHDKSRFEPYLYSYGKNKSDYWRQRLEKDGCKFFDVADKTDATIVDLARAHQLDIAIDLKGYTQDNRSEIFQYRPAPIQINYLGYPGSMAADFIDYIIADKVVIPEQERIHYSENIIYMPHSYQPTDNMRKFDEMVTTRADFGLPNEAFVFCCFNNNYKISPREFDIWMRILSQINGSVLWLIKSNKWAEQNLRKEASMRGINPSRIIFAERLPQSEHLARHKHADLFIDTFNYNAHTTASDALWAGLPVITKIGKQFAARVSASLLGAIGLPELITSDDAEYEALILDLATNPKKLKNINNTLNSNRVILPLFDTRRYTLNFENALNQAYDIYLKRKNPQDIWVEDAQQINSPQIRYRPQLKTTRLTIS